MNQRVTAQLNRITSTIPSRLADRCALVAALLVAALFTGLNMFHYPQYESDEGTYMASAWAMFEQGDLSYYTYTYDHPVLGWFQIGVWTKLIGGFFSFGMSSVDTGRVLMLLVTVLSTLLIFLIVRQATGRTVAALLAAIVFAASPLGVGLHRQVWLDNIATLWLLTSLYALVSANGRLSRIVLSSIAFSLAFWTKEVFAIFLPGMLYLASAQAHFAHRRFAFALWGTTTVSAMSLFVLLAFLKDELLPPGVLWSSEEEHVSLIGTYLYQMARGTGDGALSLDGAFGAFLGQWVGVDYLLMLSGLAAAGFGLLLWRRDRYLFGVAILTFSCLLFLGRGGVVLHYYVIPLLALLTLAIGLTTGHLANVAIRRGVPKRPIAVAFLVFTVMLVQGDVHANNINFTADRTPAQREMVSWIADNLPSDSVMLMDAYPWVELHDPSFTDGSPFPNAHYFQPAMNDPTVREGVLQDNWRNIDYLAYSPSMDESFSWINGEIEGEGQSLPLIKEAREKSDELQTFQSGDWEMEIRRVRKPHQYAAAENPVLAKTWASYKESFIENGRVVDPKANRITTSEGESYALLQATYMDDQQTFDEVWGWTQENLQVREDALFSWQWGTRSDQTQGVLDEDAATDADQDIALALLFAAQRWDAPEYQREALEIINAIWEQETATIDDRPVVVAGTWARGDGVEGSTQPVVNPSYFAPYEYRIFAEVDPNHEWMNLVDSSYEVLAQIQADPEFGGEAGLVPNWVALDAETGALLPADEDEVGTPPMQFSFDASRVPWRLALDWLWFKDDRARKTLDNLSLPRQELQRDGRLLAAYEADGTPAVEYEATSMYAGVLPGLLLANDREERDLAHQVFAEEILGSYVDGPGSAYWGDDPEDYYNQNMAWFATAIMEGSMSNLWMGETTIDWNEALYFDEEQFTTTKPEVVR
jgi:endoglucanase